MPGTDALNSDTPVGIVGLNSSGAQTNFVNADSHGNMNVVGYETGPVSPGTAAPTAALIAAIFNTALPTPTNGQQVALQVDAASRLITRLLTSADVVTSRTQDGSGNAITSDNPGTAANQRLHVATPDTTTASTALGALNAAVSISLAGLSSVGFQLSAGTLIGTLIVECSLDGGVSYPGVGSFYDPSNSTVATSITFASSNTAKTVSLLPIGGSSHVRVRVSSYTSGTANSLLRASQVTGTAGAVTAAAFGTVTNTFPTVTANVATLILAANPNRKYAYIANSTGTACNIQFSSGTGLSTTTGLQVPAKSFYELKGDNLYTGNIYAFAASGISLSVTEGTP